MVAWTRLASSGFAIESADAWQAKWVAARWPETISHDPAEMFFVLNVIPATDGWAYVIFGNRGYEDVGIRIYRYSPEGFIEIGTPYAAGC